MLLETNPTGCNSKKVVIKVYNDQMCSVGQQIRQNQSSMFDDRFMVCFFLRIFFSCRGLNLDELIPRDRLGINLKAAQMAEVGRFGWKSDRWLRHLRHTYRMQIFKGRRTLASSSSLSLSRFVDPGARLASNFYVAVGRWPYRLLIREGTPPVTPSRKLLARGWSENSFQKWKFVICTHKL